VHGNKGIDERLGWRGSSGCDLVKEILNGFRGPA